MSNSLKNLNKKNNIIISGLIWIIFACIFIIPSFDTSKISITKYIFLLAMLFLYLIYIKNIYLWEIIFIGFIFIQVFFSKSINSLSLIGIVVLYKLIKLKKINEIKNLLLKSKVTWISLFATFIYSILFMSDGRYIHTAVREINQSGLAILCLGLIIKRKRKFVGNLILLSGLLTFSRNYMLALVILIIFNSTGMNKLVKKLKLEKKLTFLNIALISSLILLIIGVFYQSLYVNGKIVNEYSQEERLFKFFDRSNYFRFTVNNYNFIMYAKKPELLLSGVPNIDEYKNYCYEIASDSGQLYVGNTPHNFIFSYIRLYGIGVVIAFIYISKIIKSVVNKNNFKIFLAVMSYAIFMSAGFNTFWLYLTVFTLIVNE